MKNILSENMLRFGTKNLSEAAQQELVVKSIMETIDHHGLHGAVRRRLMEQTVPGDVTTYVENYRKAVIAAFPNTFQDVPGKTDNNGYIPFPGNNPQEYIYVYTNGAVTLPNDKLKLLKQLQTVHDNVVLNGVSDNNPKLRTAIANLTKTAYAPETAQGIALKSFDQNKIIAMNQAFLTYKAFLEKQNPSGAPTKN